MTVRRSSSSAGLAKVGVGLLAASMLVAGAGAAQAQTGSSAPAAPHDHPMRVEGRGADARVTFTNTTEDPLSCFGFVGRADMVENLYRAHLARVMDDAWPGESKILATLPGDRQGRIAAVASLGPILPGTSEELPVNADGFGGERWVLTDATFAPSAFVYCDDEAGTTQKMALEPHDDTTGSLSMGSLGSSSVSVSFGS